MQKNKMLNLLYKFLIICGFFLFSVGLLFYFLHWPEMFQGIYIGPVFIILGIITFVCLKLGKNQNMKDL